MPRAFTIGIAGLLTASAITPVGAQDLAHGTADAHAVAHAGAGVVSDDGSGALWKNPAAMARRTHARAQLGLTSTDRESRYDTDREFASLAPPTISDRATTQTAFWGGAQFPVSDFVVLGAAWLAPPDLVFASATPRDYNRPGDDGPHEYAQRYAATRFALQRRGVGVAGSLQPTPWLAVGASALAFETRVADERMIWAGAAGDTPYANDYDLGLTISSRDRFVPAFVLGVIVAPPSAPIEIGASFFWSDAAHLAGAPRLRPSRGTVSGLMDPLATAQVAPDAQANETMPLPWVARAGVRFFFSRFSIDVEGELAYRTAAELAWQLDGVTVSRFDGRAAPLTRVPWNPVWRTSFASRAALETDVVPGFLSLTAGYAYTRADVTPTSLSTSMPTLDAHTAALGADVRAGGFLVSIGVAHAFHVARTTSSADTTVAVVAPFREVPLPAAGGRYDGSRTSFALTVEYTLP